MIHMYSNCVGDLLVGDMYVDLSGFMLYVGEKLLCRKRFLSDVILSLQLSESARYSVSFVDICS